MKALSTARRALYVLGVSLGVALGSTTAARAQVPARPAAPPPIVAAPGGVLVDFQDAELRYVISALAEAAGMNVVYGDLPSRKITMHMRQPVAKENISALLRSIAQSNGLVAIDDGGMMRLEVAEGARGMGSRSEPSQLGGSGAELRLYVYRLRHARAPKLAGTLQSIFGGARSSANNATQRGNTLSDRLRSSQIPPLASPETQTMSRSDSAMTNGGSLPGQLQGDVQIVPEETTNSLLIRASPSDWQIINQAIAALDLRPLQVIIEVLIAEVRHTDDFNFGVSASASDAASSDRQFKRSGSFGGAAPDATDFIFKLVRSSPDNISITLSALAAKGLVRIVSRPVLFAQNNLEARILVGSERPFVQVSRSLPTDAAVRDQVIQYRDVGTKLSITPTINPDGYVNLQVTQEVSTATSETQFGAPIISTREASTHVFIKDGQTGVIGGLIDRETDRNRSGIPFLSDIPYLGALFGKTTITTLNNELILFLTPHIVTTDDDAERIRRDMETRAKGVEEAIKENPSVFPAKPVVTPPVTVPAPAPVKP